MGLLTLLKGKEQAAAAQADVDIIRPFPSLVKGICSPKQDEAQAASEAATLPPVMQGPHQALQWLALFIGHTVTGIIRVGTLIASLNQPEHKALQLEFLMLANLAHTLSTAASLVSPVRSLALGERLYSKSAYLLRQTENAATQLNTWLVVTAPAAALRGLLLAVQALFLLPLMFAHLVAPVVPHTLAAFIAEAVRRRCVFAYNAYEGGRMENWCKQPADPLSIAYWDLEDNATLVDVIGEMREDAGYTSMVNYALSSTKTPKEWLPLVAPKRPQAIEAPAPLSPCPVSPPPGSSPREHPQPSEASSWDASHDTRQSLPANRALSRQEWQAQAARSVDQLFDAKWRSSDPGTSTPNTSSPAQSGRRGIFRSRANGQAVDIARQPLLEDQTINGHSMATSGATSSTTEILYHQPTAEEVSSVVAAGARRRGPRSESGASDRSSVAGSREVKEPSSILETMDSLWGAK